MIAALVFALFACLFQAQDDDSRLRSCLKQLESDEPGDREAAADELVRHGERVARMISASREATKGEARARLDDVLRRLREGAPVTLERMRTTVIDLAMAKPTLSAVVREVRLLTGITIKLEGTEENDPQFEDLDYRRITIEALLNHIGRQINYRWGIDRAATVPFMPQGEFLNRHGVRRKIDVRDLLRPVPGVEVIRMGLLNLPEPSPAAGGETRILTCDTILAAIRDGTHPDSWYVEPSRMGFDDGFLVLWNVPEVCEDAQEVVATLRRCLVPNRVKLTLIALRESAVEGLREGSGFRMEALKETLSGGKDAAIVAEQEISILNDVPAFSFSGRETLLVTDYDRQGEFIRQLMREGLGVSVRATSTGDGRGIRVAAEATVCRLDRVDRFPTKHGEIQMPVISSSIFRVDQIVPLNQTVVALSLGGVSSCGPEFSRLLVLIRVSSKP